MIKKHLLMLLLLVHYLLLLQLLFMMSLQSRLTSITHNFFSASGNIIHRLFYDQDRPFYPSNHTISKFIHSLLKSSTLTILTLQYQSRIHTMTACKEIVICLNRLTLPLGHTLTKLTLAVQNGPIEHFIQNSKSVRSQKINFYRENVFVQHNSQGLRFKLYAVQENGGKKEIATLAVEGSELMAIQKRPKAFKSESKGYELIWDCWLFSEDSSYLSQESSRDYSELDLPLNLLENNQSLNSSYSSYWNSSSLSKRPQQARKRSNSADQTSSNQQRQVNEDDSQNNISKSPSKKNKSGPYHQPSQLAKRGNVGNNLSNKLQNPGSRILAQH